MAPRGIVILRQLIGSYPFPCVSGTHRPRSITEVAGLEELQSVFHALDMLRSYNVPRSRGPARAWTSADVSYVETCQLRRSVKAVKSHVANLSVSVREGTCPSPCLIHCDGTGTLASRLGFLERYAQARTTFRPGRDPSKRSPREAASISRDDPISVRTCISAVRVRHRHECRSQVVQVCAHL